MVVLVERIDVHLPAISLEAPLKFHSEKQDSDAGQKHSTEYLPDDQFPQKWVARFMSYKGTRPQDTFVAIVDTVEAQLNYRIFQNNKLIFCNTHFSEQDLHSALNSAETNPVSGEPRGLIKARIILLFHAGCKEVDRAAVSSLVTQYKIDPLFLMTHFYWDCQTRLDVDEDYDKGIQELSKLTQPPSLPSIIDFIALDFAGEQFTAYIPENVNPRTGKKTFLLRLSC